MSYELQIKEGKTWRNVDTYRSKIEALDAQEALQSSAPENENRLLENSALARLAKKVIATYDPRKATMGG